MSVKISFVIKDPKSSDLQPVYVKVKRDGAIEERATSAMVQLVDGKIMGNEVLQLKLRGIKRDILNSN